MAKIKYPNDGISIVAGGQSQQAIDSFNDAIRNCDFDVPYDFPYREWINGLRQELEKCRNTIQEYHDKTKRTDTDNQNSSAETVSLVQNLDTVTIEERQRIIKE